MDYLNKTCRTCIWIKVLIMSKRKNYCYSGPVTIQTHVCIINKYNLCRSTESGKAEKSIVLNTWKTESIAIIENASNLGMAIHWLPGSQLWSGKLSNTTVGILGIISSSVGLAKMLSN